MLVLASNFLADWIFDEFPQYEEPIQTIRETFKISTVGETIQMRDYVEYAIQTIRERRKYMKEASDNKSEENIPPFKLNFNGGQISSLLLSCISGDWVCSEWRTLHYHACFRKPVISGCQRINFSAVP